VARAAPVNFKTLSPSWCEDDLLREERDAPPLSTLKNSRPPYLGRTFQHINDGFRVPSSLFAGFFFLLRWLGFICLRRVLRLLNHRCLPGFPPLPPTYTFLLDRTTLARSRTWNGLRSFFFPPTPSLSRCPPPDGRFWSPF